MKLPKNRRPIHPGQVLLHEFLVPMGITQKILAKHLKWSYARVNEIVNGRRGVTMDTALSFSETFETSVEFWINLQVAYDLYDAKSLHVSVSKLAPKDSLTSPIGIQK